MAANFLWFNQEFPWLRRGFVHAVAADYADEFCDELATHGFRILHIAPRDVDGLFRELGTVLEFPDYYGGSGWDAVHDCFGDIDVPERGVILWENAASFAGDDPKAFGEACHVLNDIFEWLSQREIQFALVLTGEGAAFSRP